METGIEVHRCPLCARHKRNLASKRYDVKTSQPQVTTRSPSRSAAAASRSSRHTKSTPVSGGLRNEKCRAELGGIGRANWVPGKNGHRLCAYGKHVSCTSSHVSANARNPSSAALRSAGVMDPSRARRSTALASSTRVHAPGDDGRITLEPGADPLRVQLLNHERHERRGVPIFHVKFKGVICDRRGRRRARR